MVFYNGGQCNTNFMAERCSPFKTTTMAKACLGSGVGGLVLVTLIIVFVSITCKDLVSQRIRQPGFIITALVAAGMLYFIPAALVAISQSSSNTCTPVTVALVAPTTPAESVQFIE